MKKSFIASFCAISICFFSCASNSDLSSNEEQKTQTPATQTSQNEQQNNSENQENQNAEQTESKTVVKADSKTQEQTSDKNSNKEQNSTSNEDEIEVLTSKDFPLPDLIDEPEIITVEPEDFPKEKSEANIADALENETAASEELLISDENETENQTEQTVQNSENLESQDLLQNGESENQNEETEPKADNSLDPDITANDIIIEENNSNDVIEVSGGIDITEINDEENNAETSSQKVITPSRSVTLKKFEYVDITYPGTGWIYMGLTDNSKDLAYFGRKLGTADTQFTLQARASGKKIIHFYKNDALSGKYLDDYIEVIILAENGSNKTHVKAPEYKIPVQKKESPKQNDLETFDSENSENENEKSEEKSVNQNNAQNAAQTNSQNQNAQKVIKANSTANTNQKKSAAQNEKAEQTSAEQTTSVVKTSGDATLLKEAELLYNEKEYPAALKKINQYIDFSSDNADYALYLKGQILEAKSEVQDIKSSMQAYTTLTKNYPSSKFWDNANKRIIYLRRFYLEVR